MIKNMQYNVISLNVKELQSLNQKIKYFFYITRYSSNSSSLTKIQKLPESFPNFPLPTDCTSSSNHVFFAAG